MQNLKSSIGSVLAAIVHETCIVVLYLESKDVAAVDNILHSLLVVLHL